MATISTTFSGEGVSPSVVSASMTGNVVKIVFSESMDVTSATTLDNYAIPGMSISRASMQPRSDNKNVLLTVTGFQPSTSYTVTVSNVTDSVGNTVE